MIENINEIKYPVIVKGDCTYLYENPSSAAILEYPLLGYRSMKPITENDIVCTRDFLKDKVVKVKCLEERNYLRSLCSLVGMREVVLTNGDFAVFTQDYYSFTSEPNNPNFQEIALPFPDSIYKKDVSLEDETSTNESTPSQEPLVQGDLEGGTLEGGDCMPKQLHSLAERYGLSYSYHPKGGSTEYFLVDYKEITYKIDTFGKVVDFEKMIMIEKGLCYE
jgi:hypothetical protein